MGLRARPDVKGPSLVSEVVKKRERERRLRRFKFYFIFLISSTYTTKFVSGQVCNPDPISTEQKAMLLTDRSKVFDSVSL